MSERPVELTLAAIYRILKNAGIARVQKDALIEFRALIENIALNVAKIALEICARNGRTIMIPEDVSSVRRIVSEILGIC
ncbi:MAG: NFYB/HAP3 family transcription factor subunit [Candidatus Korarchaeota archaeon]